MYHQFFESLFPANEMTMMMRAASRDQSRAQIPTLGTPSSRGSQAWKESCTAAGTGKQKKRGRDEKGETCQEKEAGQNRIPQSTSGGKQGRHQLYHTVIDNCHSSSTEHADIDRDVQNLQNDEGKHTFEQVPVGHADRRRLELIANAKTMDLSKASGT